MRRLHSQIYASGNLTAIDAAAYLGNVVDQVDAAFGALQQRVRITRRLEPIVVDVDTAVPLGLITTELLTNAYRYAFPDGSAGTIGVALTLQAGMVELAITDNGIGLPTELARPVFNRIAAGPGARQTSWRHVGDKQWTRPVRNGLFPSEEAGHDISLKSKVLCASASITILSLSVNSMFLQCAGHRGSAWRALTAAARRAIGHAPSFSTA